MKKAGMLAILIGFAVCLPGCGFTEGTDAVVTVVKNTPTPTPTNTPTPTPTPAATPTPVPVIETSPSGVEIEVKEATYTANSEVNIRSDASTENSDIMASAVAGEELHGTGVSVDGKWIRILYNDHGEDRVYYVSADFVTEVAAGASAEAPAEGTQEAPAEGTEAAPAP